MPFKVEIHHSGNSFFQKEQFFHLEDRIIHIREKETPPEFRILRVKKADRKSLETYLQSRAGKWKFDPNDPSLEALNKMDFKLKKSIITSFPENKRQILGYTTHLCEIQGRSGNLNHQVYLSSHSNFEGLPHRFSEDLPGFPLAWTTRQEGKIRQTAEAVFAGFDFDPDDIPQPSPEEYESFSLGSLNKMVKTMGFSSWKDWWKLVKNLAGGNN